MPILLIIQIVISIVLIVLILLQQRGTALGSAFGGGQDGFYMKKRGPEKTIFIASIIFAILFIVFSVLNLIS